MLPALDFSLAISLLCLLLRCPLSQAGELSNSSHLPRLGQWKRKHLPPDNSSWWPETRSDWRSLGHVPIFEPIVSWMLYTAWLGHQSQQGSWWSSLLNSCHRELKEVLMVLQEKLLFFYQKKGGQYYTDSQPCLLLNLNAFLWEKVLSFKEKTSPSSS